MRRASEHFAVGIVLVFWCLAFCYFVRNIARARVCVFVCVCKSKQCYTNTRQWFIHAETVKLLCAKTTLTFAYSVIIIIAVFSNVYMNSSVVFFFIVQLHFVIKKNFQ